MRRALTHVGGEAALSGDPDLARKLAEALAVAPSEQEGDTRDEGEDATRAHVHGFHSYPARMHPLTAARLVRALTEPDMRVLDPFCGSGTVLVETLLAGREPYGTDLNPLAVRLSQAKLRTWPEGYAEQLLSDAKAAAAFADERRKARAGASRRFGPEDVALFSPHVLLELGSLQEFIRGSASKFDLELVLSSLLTKLSRRSGDSARSARAPREEEEGAREKRIAAGYPAKLLVKKTTEWIARKTQFDDLKAAATASMTEKGMDFGRCVRIENASVLKSLGAGIIDAIVTSPPYAATYDYYEHHADRLRWLDMDGSAFHALELGSRRSYRALSPADTRRKWTTELTEMLRAFERVLAPGGTITLMMADSATRATVLRADELVADAARPLGLTLLAAAAQARPHFHLPTAAAFEREPRREHALLLGRRDE
ncbi:MAG: DNA methyltransferase [Polyangiaceae bacterium]